MSDSLELAIASMNAKLVELNVKLNNAIATQLWMAPLYPFDGCRQSAERWENLRYEIAAIESTIRQFGEHLAKEKAKLIPFAISAVEAAEVVGHPGLANMVAEYL
jgi:hypothetical protein